MHTAGPMRLARCRGDLLGVGALLLLVAKLTSGIARVRDLPGADEAIYGVAGLRVLAALEGHGPPAFLGSGWAPLYSVWYAAVGAACPDRARVFDLQWALLVAATTLGFYAVSRALQRSVTTAVVVAAAPLATSFFHVTPYVSHFYLVVLLGGCALACACRGWRARAGVLVATLGCAAFVRPEAAVAFVPCALAYAAAEALSTAARAGGLRALGRVARALVLPAALLLVFGDPLAGSRAFYAFSQHYAFTVTRQERLPGDPWMGYAGLMHRDFGDASSIGEALRANPAAFAAHAAYDLRELPGNVLDLFALRRSVTAASSVPWQIVSAVLLGVAAVALVGLWRSASRRQGRTAVVRWTFALACVAAAPGVVLVFPRAHYLVAPCAFAWVLAGSALGARLQRTRALRGVPRGTRFVAIVAAFAWLVPSPAASEPAPAPVRRAVTALAAMQLAPAPVLAADSDLMTMAGYDAPTVLGWSKSEPLSALLAREGIGVVTLEEPVLGRAAFADDPDVAALLASPGRHGFCLVYAEPGVVRVLVRPQLLSAPQREGWCE